MAASGGWSDLAMLVAASQGRVAAQSEHPVCNSREEGERARDTCIYEICLDRAEVTERMLSINFSRLPLSQTSHVVGADRLTRPNRPVCIINHVSTTSVIQNPRSDLTTEEKQPDVRIQNQVWLRKLKSAIVAKKLI